MLVFVQASPPSAPASAIPDEEDPLVPDDVVLDVEV
jgi:hypothetical protein